MISNAATTSTSLVEAISFLTRPLSPFIPYSALNSLQQILLSTFTALPTWCRNGRLSLLFTSSTPPRAIFDACIATQVDWSDWFYALGGREFDLTIEQTSVTLKSLGISGRIVIWKETPVIWGTFPQHPRPEQRFHGSAGMFDQPTHYEALKANMNHPPSYTQPKTLAQQLLQSEHEMDEANEIFTMISNINPSLIPPTPALKNYAAPRATVIPCLPTLSALDEEIFHSQNVLSKNSGFPTRNLPSPVSSPESSRSSSPSTHSAISSENLMTMSKTSPSLASLALNARPPQSVTKSFPSFSRRKTPPQINSVINSHVQRYLYQGGQSTILTGGVMLGATTKASALSPPGNKSQVLPPRMRNLNSQRGLWRCSTVTHS